MEYIVYKVDLEGFIHQVGCSKVLQKLIRIREKVKNEGFDSFIRDENMRIIQ